MRSLLIALLVVFTGSTANAVTFLTAPDDYNFGSVPVGEMRQELLVFDTSHWNSDIVTFYPSVGHSIRAVHYFESVTINDPFDHYDLSIVNCGPYSGSHTVCVDAKLTSRGGFHASAELIWTEVFYELTVYPDGREVLNFGTFDHYFSSTIDYTVPLPASLPLMLSGLGLLGWLRKR